MHLFLETLSATKGHINFDDLDEIERLLRHYSRPLHYDLEEKINGLHQRSITTLLSINFPVERGNPEGEQLIAFAQELDGLAGTDILAFLEKKIFKPSTEHALAAP